MTTSELAREVFSIVEKKIRLTPSSFEFEMAYQARLAMERIRFVIRLIEAARDEATDALEAGIQLLEALNCLESRTVGSKKGVAPVMFWLIERMV